MAAKVPAYKRCKNGVGKSGAKKGKLLKGYIWPGGGRCPVKGKVGGGKKASPKKSRAKSRRSVASFHKSQAAAAGRYGAGAESFIRRAKRTKTSRAATPASYRAQSAALKRIFGPGGGSINGYYSLRAPRHKRRSKR